MKGPWEGFETVELEGESNEQPFDRVVKALRDLVIDAMAAQRSGEAPETIDQMMAVRYGDTPDDDWVVIVNWKKWDRETGAIKDEPKKDNG